MHSNVLLMTRLRTTGIWELLLPWNRKFLQRMHFLQASSLGLYTWLGRREKIIVFIYWTFKSIFWIPVLHTWHVFLDERRVISVWCNLQEALRSYRTRLTESISCKIRQYATSAHLTITNGDLCCLCSH